MVSISVLLATYNRTHSLKDCLEGLKQQSRLPDEIIVIVRDSDSATWDFCREYLTPSWSKIVVKFVTVKVPGQVAALNCGLNEVKSDLICITDDDAIPHPQWIEKIERHFSTDSSIAGVGGRDWVYQDGVLLQESVKIIGKVQWFGRVIGNHCFGNGPMREVDILKGANMSYRRDAVKDLLFDTRLLGSGAQVHNDLAFSLELRKRSHKLIYDPEVCVNHFPAVRFDEDGRDVFSSVAFKNAAHNETLILLNYLPPLRKIAYLIWSILIGTRGKPGIFQLIRFSRMPGFYAFDKWKASLEGSWCGIIAWLTLKKLSHKVK